MGGAWAVAGLAADVDFIPARGVGVGGGIVALAQVGAVAFRAHQVPVLVAARPVHWVAGAGAAIGIEVEPALAAGIPGHRQGLQAAAGKFDEVLLERVDAEGVFDFVLTGTAVFAGGVDVIAPVGPVEAPALLKKFFGEWSLSTQEEHWKGSAAKGYECDLKITLKNVPVNITGKWFLSGDANGCVNDVTMNFECGIPLVGNKLASFVGNSAVVVMKKEYEHIRDSF